MTLNQFKHFTFSLSYVKKNTNKQYILEYHHLHNETRATFDNYGFMLDPTHDFKHHHYKEMEEFLFNYNSTYANITSLKSIGKSVQGRELYVMVLSNTPEKHVPGKCRINH